MQGCPDCTKTLLSRTLGRYHFRCADWKGDNTVLTLQTGRYLLSCYKAVVQDKKKVPDGVAFVNKIPHILSAKATGDPVCLDCIADAFDSVSANFLAVAGQQFMKALQETGSEESAMERVALARFKAAKAHCQGYLFHRFHAATSQAPGDLKAAMTDLCQLYGLYTINENAGPFLQFGFYKPEHIPLIQSAIYGLYEKIRPQVIPLTDAFNFTDYVINSPLGCYDGNAYQRYFEQVVRSNPIGTPHPYYERTIKPVLLRDESKWKEQVIAVDDDL